MVNKKSNVIKYIIISILLIILIIVLYLNIDRKKESIKEDDNNETLVSCDKEVSLSVGEKYLLENDSWESSDSSVAIINNGSIEALSEGDTTIKIKKDQKVYCYKVHVEKIKVTSISFNSESIVVKEGESLKLDLNILPSNATDYLITWSSSDENVAMVSENGQIMAKKEGSTIITVKVEDLSSMITVNVIPNFTLDKTNLSLSIDSIDELKVKGISENDSAKVLWNSSDSSIASVDKLGRIIAKNPGTVTITANFNNQTASCVITVKDEKKEVRSYTLNGYTWNNHKYQYWLYKPNNVTSNKYPLVVFLGGNYTVRAYVYNINKYGLPKYISEGKDYPFYMISPYCPHDMDYCGHTGIANFHNNNLHAFVMDLIKYMIDNYNIDPDRIILAGDETGGSGAYFIASTYKNNFSCIVTTDGAGAAYSENNKSYVEPKNLLNIPIWVFQAKNNNPDMYNGIDPNKVGVDRYKINMDYTEKLKNAGCNLKVNVIDGAMYKDTGSIFQKQEVIDWMILNKKR